MFNNQAELTAGYQEARLYYERLSARIDWLAPIDMARGWDIYHQAFRASYNILVMGRTTVDEPTRTPHQFGNAITIEDHEALGVITHGSEAAMVHLHQQGAGHLTRTTGGMIMHFYAELTHLGNLVGPGAQWRRGRSGYHFFYNDCWLLGGAHAHHDFNLASPRRLTNVWDQRGNRLTATGRELAFLYGHGYSFANIPNRNLGILEVATCKRPRMALGASFGSLVRSITRYREQADVCRLAHG